MEFRKRFLAASRVVPLVSICIAAATALPAIGAEVKPAVDAGVTNEVIVTARRREETIQKVPLAISAFTAQDLDRTGTTNIGDLSEVIPSVTLEPSRATNSTLTAFIRGVGQQDPLAGFEQGVALYIDDVYIARPQGALLDIFDIERIEVLRGPQGTLYGRNAVGGAIKYVTRRLGPDPEASARLSYGSYNQIDAVGSFSAPVSDVLRVGGAVATLNHGGYGKNLTTGKGNYNKQVLAGRFSVEYLPSNALFVRLTGDYTLDDSNPVAGHRVFPAAVSGTPVLSNVYDTYAGASINASTAGINGKNQVKSRGIHGLIEWHPTDMVTLKSITAYRKDDTKSVIDFDSLAVDDFDAPVTYNNKQFSQEVQALYQSSRLNGVLGFYYLDAKAANDFDVVLGQTGRVVYGLPLTAYTGGSVNTNAWSIFGDVTYDITDAFSLSLGGRYTSDKRSADIFRANYFGEGSPFFGNTSASLIAVTSDFQASRRFTNFTPRAVLSYEASDNVNTYVSYSKGFKAGSFDPRGANFSTPEVENGYLPETLDSYEAGIKAALPNGRGHVNMDVFYSNYNNMQIPGSLPIDTNGDGINDDFVGAVTNAGKSVIKGIEVESQFLIITGLSVTANMSLLDPTIKHWIVNGVDVADQRRIQNTPKFMAFVGANYSFDLASGMMNLNGGWSHKSSTVQFETPVPEIDQKAYDLFNASVVWTSADGHWSIGIHGKNLSNKHYKTSGYNFPTLGLEDNVTVFYGAPRTVTGTVEFKM
jgi:iron complex outermembrane receptor protein